MSVKLTDPEITTDPLKVITQAADFLEKYPEVWGQGAWVITESETGDHEEFTDDNYYEYDKNACNIGGICTVCLEGALLLFAGDWITYNRAKNIVEMHLGQEPADFNDDGDTTAIAIVKALRDSAESKRFGPAPAAA